MGWTFRGSNTGGGDIFRNSPDQPWGPRSLDHPPSSSAKNKERVELYIYSPSGYL